MKYVVVCDNKGKPFQIIAIENSKASMPEIWDMIYDILDQCEYSIYEAEKMFPEGVYFVKSSDWETIHWY